VELVNFKEEVLHQIFTVAHALQDAVHETGIAKVLEADEATFALADED
jgi:hypothetical protein